MYRTILIWRALFIKKLPLTMNLKPQSGENNPSKLIMHSYDVKYSTK